MKKISIKVKKIDWSRVKKSMYTVGARARESQMLVRLVIICVLALANILGGTLFARLDLTQNQQYSLSKASKDLLGKLDADVTIEIYFSSNLPSNMLSVRRDVIDLAREYERYGKGRVSVDVVNPESEDFSTRANAHGISELQFSELAEDRYEIAQGILGVAIVAGDEYKSMPVVTESAGLEYELSSQIFALTNDSKPSLVFLAGNGEKSIYTDFTMLSDLLSTQFTVTELDLDTVSEIQGETSVVIMAAPTSELSEADLYKLDQYLLAGGRIVVLADPYVNNFQAGTLTLGSSNLNTMLTSYGLSVESKLLLDQSYTPIQSGNRQYAYPFWVLVQPENIATDLPPLRDLQSSTFFWASPVVVESDCADNPSCSDRVTQLLQTTDQAWINEGASVALQPEEFVIVEGGQYSLATLIEGEFTSAFEGKPLPSDLASATFTTERRSTGDGKLLVFGDSDFLTDSFIQGNEQNALLFLNLAEWLSNADELSTIRSKDISTRPLAVLTSSEKNITRAANILIIPLLVAASGIAYTTWRKKQPSYLSA